MESERLDRLDTMIAENRIIRGQWTEGQERACLLAALSPETGEQRSAQACPATVMPPWLAELTPWMDDSGTLEAWPAMLKRYAAVARRWHVLKAQDWKRLDYRCRQISVQHARQFAVGHDACLKAVDGVIELLSRQLNNDEPTREEWKAAASAAWAAAAAAAAAWAAASAAWAAAAASAAWASAAWAAAEAGAAAWAASADKITDQILSAIEDACTKAESCGT